jgi:hypothetical protein
MRFSQKKEVEMGKGDYERINKAVAEVKQKEIRLENLIEDLIPRFQDAQRLQSEINLAMYALDKEFMALTGPKVLAARIVEAMWMIHQCSDLRNKYIRNAGSPGEWLLIGDIACVINEHGVEIKARGLGEVIRGELQLKVGNRKNAGFPVFWEEVKMVYLANRYGIDYEAMGKGG